MFFAHGYSFRAMATVLRKRAPELHLSPAQMRALDSSFRLELVASFQAKGVMSVAEVAATIGKPAKSTYYQIRELLRVNLIEEVGSRGEGRKREALYDVVADRIRLVQDVLSIEYRENLARMVRSTLRKIERQYEAANAVLDGTDGNRECLFILSYTANLEEHEVREIRDRFQAVLDYARDHNRNDKPVPLSIVMATAPASIPYGNIVPAPASNGSSQDGETAPGEAVMKAKG